MKNKLTTIAMGISLFCSANLAFSATYSSVPASTGRTHLVVVNMWEQGAVHVKEGTVVLKESTLGPKQSLDWTMYSGVISGLQINYYHDGYWSQIPGCPSGVYTTDLRVYIAGANWDNSTPICHLA